MEEPHPEVPEDESEPSRLRSEGGARFPRLARLHARLHRNRMTSLVTKGVVTLAGCLVLLAGLVMMVTPGPGIVGLVLGLAILSVEWPWAERWLASARRAAERAAEKARAVDPAVRRRRVLGATAGALLLCLVVAGGVRLYGWPGPVLDGWEFARQQVAFLPALPGG